MSEWSRRVRVARRRLLAHRIYGTIAWADPERDYDLCSADQSSARAEPETNIRDNWHPMRFLHEHGFRAARLDSVRSTPFIVICCWTGSDLRQLGRAGQRNILLVKLAIALGVETAELLHIF